MTEEQDNSKKQRHVLSEYFFEKILESNDRIYDLLDHIYDEKVNTNEHLQLQNEKINRLHEMMDRRLQNIIRPQPMKTWRFIVIIITIILVAGAFTQ